MRIGTLVVNVGDVHRAAQFWTSALGYVVRDGPIGDDTPVLVPKEGAGPPIALDETDRMHLGLRTASAAEQQAEVERLVSLGARRVPWSYRDGADFVVLADTEGNLFCVIDARDAPRGGPGDRRRARPDLAGGRAR